MGDGWMSLLSGLSDLTSLHKLFLFQLFLGYSWSSLELFTYTMYYLYTSDHHPLVTGCHISIMLVVSYWFKLRYFTLMTLWIGYAIMAKPKIKTHLARESTVFQIKKYRNTSEVYLPWGMWIWCVLLLVYLSRWRVIFCFAFSVESSQ